MAFDGIVTYGIATELSEILTLGKIDKIYQPSPEDLLIQVYTKIGNVRLIMSSGSQSSRICLTENKYRNPENPQAFCMLLRKHLQGGRITEVRQYGSERIIEIDIEALNELGFTVSKRLIVEIMGKHSNIILLDIETGKIIDSIKRISIDVNRYRQLLPGIIYVYPPTQNKIPFKEISDSTELTGDERSIMNEVAGISPAIARQLAKSPQPDNALLEIVESIKAHTTSPRVYMDGTKPVEFHLTKLDEYDESSMLSFETLSKCVDFYYHNRASSNTIKQRAIPLTKSVQASLDKAYLKKKKLGEDLLNAENSDKFRLYGELLTANIHQIKQGNKSVSVTSYYDGSLVKIPLDEKLSPAKNAQKFFKRYSKAKTAIHEKKTQLEENEHDIKYLESVLQFIDSAASEDELDQLREELQETGYMRFRKDSKVRKKKNKPAPHKYLLSDGTACYVGRNNKENDYLTMKFANRTDVWLHTKDIPGSHVIIRLDDGRSLQDLPADLIYEAASIAAYHSKASASSNVPVDYVPVRYVKKPNGAKPGMVIFTHNMTVYADPKLPNANK